MNSKYIKSSNANDKAKEYAHKYRRKVNDWKGEISNDIYDAYKQGAEDFINSVEWKEGTPCQNGFYIITNIFGVTDVASFNGGNWKYYDNEEVIAYCELNTIKPFKI